MSNTYISSDSWAAALVLTSSELSKIYLNHTKINLLGKAKPPHLILLPRLPGAAAARAQLGLEQALTES